MLFLNRDNVVKEMQELVFKPNGKHINMASRWTIGAMLFVILYFVLRFAGREPEIALLGVVIMLGIAWFRKEPVSLTVLPAQKKLIYCYRNGLGQKKRVYVDLQTAGGSYEYKDYNNTAYGWRLLLYNGNYFKNRVSIMENAKTGFDKKQLDEIVTLVHKYRSNR